MAELTRYQEFKRLALLAGPLMTAQLAQMGMGVTDAVMAGHYGAVDLAGVALAGSLMWPVMMLFMGCLQALTPTISQLNGEQNYPEIGETVRQGIWLALIAGFLAMITLRSIGPVYALLDVDPPAAAISVAYLDYSSLGIPALMIFFSLRCLADGMSFTRPAMIIAVTALLLKIPLNYFFIYGVGDFEGHGGVGAGMAQAIIMWFQLGLIIIVVTASDLTQPAGEQDGQRQILLVYPNCFALECPLVQRYLPRWGSFHSQRSYSAGLDLRSSLPTTSR